MSQKISPVDSWKPAAGSDTTTTDHSCHTTNPRNSAKIDHRRLRAAMALPFSAHCWAFSGFQLSIQRPGRWISSCVVAGVAAAGGVAVSGRGSATVTGDPPVGSGGGAAPRIEEASHQRRKGALPATASSGAAG